MERFDSFSSSTTTDQLVFTKRQVSMIMASMLLLCLFVFIVGFFLGKRAVLDEFSSQVTQSSLQNQIDFLLTTQSLQSSHDQEDQENNNDDNGFDNDEDTVTQINLTALPQEEPTTEKKPVVKDSGLHVPLQAQPFKEEEILSKILGSDSSGVELKSKQYARLIGFGTKKAAQAFVNRLKKQNVSVILKTMISKTASGKQRTWYQAITPTYENEQELQALVTKIKRLEHIRDNDIKIVSVK